MNSRAVATYALDDVIAGDLKSKRWITLSQRGLGGYTLCKDCNVRFGNLYTAEFGKWCKQAARHLYLDSEPGTPFEFETFPLRIVKQIIVMMFSINSFRWRNQHRELVEFVSKPSATGLDPRYRLFLFFLDWESSFRLRGDEGGMEFRFEPRRIQTAKHLSQTEITYPPFGYVLDIEGESPDDRLVEISDFANYAFDECAKLELRLPVLSAITPFKLDYRSREEIRADAQASRAKSKESGTHEL
jgi:hypothetical protein